MSEQPAEKWTLAAMRETLYSAVVSDALDALGYRFQSPQVRLEPYTTDGLLVGRARTTLWQEDAQRNGSPNPYELELRAVDACRPDDVFVAAAAGSLRSGIWGELLATAASRRGCAGAIIDGATRDVGKLRTMRFPVFARGTCVYDNRGRQRLTDLDVSVEIGGVEVRPGSLIFADLDGVVVVPAEIEENVIRAAFEKVRGESAMREGIRSGMSATDAYAKYGVL